ncbi:hypothetical protein C8Q79DRAFT_630531 [Trametes meyenii]|nr:hypothetical protein C8Q79DRAFT_630531 [Trametes meyenii]
MPGPYAAAHAIGPLCTLRDEWGACTSSARLRMPSPRPVCGMGARQAGPRSVSGCRGYEESIACSARATARVDGLRAAAWRAGIRELLDSARGGHAGALVVSYRRAHLCVLWPSWVRCRARAPCSAGASNRRAWRFGGGGAAMRCADDFAADVRLSRRYEEFWLGSRWSSRRPGTVLAALHSGLQGLVFCQGRCSKSPPQYGYSCGRQGSNKTVTFGAAQSTYVCLCTQEVLPYSFTRGARMIATR